MLGHFLVFFVDDFLGSFLFVLGCHFGAFLEPKSGQNPYMGLLIVVDFILVFPLFLRSGGFYVRVMSDLFSVRFLISILVVFWSDFGVILGGFWGSKSVILGIDF